MLHELRGMLQQVAIVYEFKVTVQKLNNLSFCCENRRISVSLRNNFIVIISLLNFSCRCCSCSSASQLASQPASDDCQTGTVTEWELLKFSLENWNNKFSLLWCRRLVHFCLLCNQPRNGSVSLQMMDCCTLGVQLINDWRGCTRSIMDWRVFIYCFLHRVVFKLLRNLKCSTYFPNYALIRRLLLLVAYWN